ncbi:unnamed protein product, partial [marine sediment metagenome]
PWADLTISGDSIKERAQRDPVFTAMTMERWQQVSQDYYGDHDPSSPLISPALADLQGLPPMLITVGSEEQLYSDAERVVNNAKAANIDVEFIIGDDLTHVWQLQYLFLPEARQSIQQIGDYVRTKTS